MINNISEGLVRTATKVDPSGMIHEKEVNQQKAEKIREARPVERPGSDNKTETRSFSEKDSKYIMEHKRLVFEKYNKDGDLVFRVPPSSQPVDERA